MVRDGVHLAYEEAGAGGRPIIFLHGWGCNRTHFRFQLDYFGHSRRAIAVDLRGHGDSDKPMQRYNPDDFAEDIEWLVTELGVQRPIVVGHSMGGLVAIRFAYLYPDALSALIGIDTMWARSPGLETLGLAVTAGLQGEDHVGFVRSTVAGMFLETDDPHRRGEITDGMSSTPRHVLLSAWREQMEHLDLETPARELTVPTLYIAAQEPIVGSLDDIRAIPGLTLGQTIGSGHFPQLECPDQVNAMIETFLQLHNLG